MVISLLSGLMISLGAQLTRTSPLAENQNFSKSNILDTSYQNFVITDTFIYRYINALFKDKSIEFNDTNLNNFHRYDPVRQRWAEYGNLGNAASANRPLLFSQNNYTGFNTGFEQYQLYKFSLDSFRFYRINRPVSDLFFSPVGGQQNFIVKADFAAPFANGWTANINYQRFNQVGFYSNQANKTTNFGIGLQYSNPKKGREIFILYLSNVNQENQNGGITTDTLFNAPFFSNRLNIPVRLMDAITRHDEKSLSVVNYFSLLNPNTDESLGQRASPLSLMHRFDYQRGYYKYTDKDVRADSIFYGNFIVDSRGIRYFLRTDKISNTLLLDVRTGAIKDFKVGISHDFIIVNDEASKGIRNDLTLIAKGEISLIKNLKVNTSAAVGVGSNAGNFDIDGNINFSGKGWMEAWGGIKFFRSEPGLVFRSLILNKTAIYVNELANPFGTEFYSNIQIKKTKTGLGIRQRLVNNFLFWDEKALPSQLEGIFSASTLEIRQDFDIWVFHLENYIYFQRFSNDILGLPARYSRHNLYWKAQLFKKVLELRIGSEASFIPEFLSNQFFPLTGIFYADQITLPYRPLIDGYVTGKISKFRFFIRLENLTDFFNRKPAYYTPYYPVYDYKLRLGVRWQLLD